MKNSSRKKALPKQDTVESEKSIQLFKNDLCFIQQKSFLTRPVAFVETLSHLKKKKESDRPFENLIHFNRLKNAPTFHQVLLPLHHVIDK